MAKKKKRGTAAKAAAEIDRDEEIDDLDEALEVIPYNYTITAYGADYPVDSIVKRIDARYYRSYIQQRTGS